LKFQIEIDREEDGLWIAEIASLPGVLAYGKSEQEAVARVKALALRTTERSCSFSRPWHPTPGT